MLTQPIRLSFSSAALEISKALAIKSFAIRSFAMDSPQQSLLPAAPAADRNKEPILQVLQKVLPAEQRLKILEVASGTGQHVTHFATSLPNVTFQPSEYTRGYCNTIDRYRQVYKLPNVLPAVEIDVSEPATSWKLPDDPPLAESLDGIICTNMIHISPWKCTQGLFSAAGYLLKPSALLITYGPYAQDGVLTPQSNIAFDENLRARNPEWGIRDVRDLIKLGLEQNLVLLETFEMPANNKTLVFRKGASSFSTSSSSS